MYKKFIKLYWKLFGRPDIPPKVDVKTPINPYTNEPTSARIYRMYELYKSGHTVEDLALIYNVTRERIRQCLWKAYREGYEKV